MKGKFDVVKGSEMKTAALWIVWCFFALFFVIALFAKPEVPIILSVAGCVVHYLLCYEKTGL